MSITRRCDNPDCAAIIDEPIFIEVTGRVLATDGSEGQDARKIEGAIDEGQSYGEYCRGCVESGAALKDIIHDLIVRGHWPAVREDQ